jgi:signal transduction histidine kinase
MSGRDARDELAVELAALRAEQQRLFERIGANERHFRGLARSVLRVQEDERRRFARELHDGIGQNLTALKHRLQALQAQVGDGDVAARLADALALCADTLEDTRSLSRLLRPQILDDLGLVAALRWLARSSGEAGGFQVEVECDCDTLPAGVDGDVSTFVFRIAQEGFANIVRHARAGQVWLRLRCTDTALQMMLVDDGVGFEPEAALAAASASRGSGLAGMRERAEMFGAQLRWTTAPGEGTQLRLRVPLDGTAARES